MHRDGFDCEALESRVLFAATAGSDPITNDNPLWAIPQGTAVIDGVLDEAAWANAYSTVRSLATRDNAYATVYMMYDANGIYLAADVRDQYLWADGNGNGEGNRWQLENDDSITFYFDVNNSRDEYFQADDFAIGYNIADFSAPKNDATQPVRRYKFVKGDGAGGAPDVGWFGGDWNAVVERGDDPEDYYVPTGTTWKTVTTGTINDNSDLDTGWTTELFLPWSSLGMTAPTHGTTIGMNFDIIMDDTGGTRDLNSHRYASDRWDVPVFADDHVVGVHSSYNLTNPGVHGPSSYAQAMFLDATTATGPAAITDLASANTTGYSTQLTFTAPTGTTTGLGHVSRYEIRYASSPITTQQDWTNATVFENRYVPRLAGNTESLRFIGLKPGTTYYVAIRSVDALGNLSDMATTSLTTQSAAQDTSKGQRLVPNPMGRNLVTENNEPFFAVGDHLGLSWYYTRQLFPGDIWDSTNNTFQNFHDNLPVEGSYTDYFNELEAKGINTMRVFLEQPSTQAAGNTQLPNGSYWLEDTPGVYNPDMKGFLDNLLAQADQHGIYVILSPFSTFYYPDSFDTEGPWSTAFGGPLSSINDFFQTPETLTIAKNRMHEVVSWVQSSPYASRVLGYEVLNEWNTTGWTINAEGDGIPGRAPEMQRRAQWLGDLAAYIKQIDPLRMTINTPVVEIPRGPIARSVFYDRRFDITIPHLYSLGVSEGINNPSTDRSVQPSLEQGRETARWMNFTTDRRPLLNGEWGPVRASWPTGKTFYTDQTYTDISNSYSSPYTLQEDEDLYSAVVWSSIATGQFGTPLRMGSDLLNFVVGTNQNGRTIKQGYLLSDGMRNAQQLVSTFMASSAIGFDVASFSPDPLTGKLSVASASGFTLHAFGSSDGSQGIVYVLQDRDAMSGTVSDGIVTITGLDLDSLFDIEIWDTANGTTSPTQVLSNVFSPDGTLTINLPAFTKGTVLRFKAHRSVGQIEQIVALNTSTKTLTFTRGIDKQPVVTIFDSSTKTSQIVDIAALTGFRGRVVDMSPYRTPNGRVHLAVTDEQHHLWIFNGDLSTGSWDATDMTAQIDAPGITGDLTVYQPKWNAIHIGGLDAQGHAINYWWAPGLTDWQYTDLTALLNGPSLAGGLAGFVAPWGALNLAGLNDNGEVVVYWWAPGMDSWQIVNMTTTFNGPTLTGQLSAFVTPWGALNIIGLNDAGHTMAYWWVPGASSWMIADLTSVTGAEPYAQGITTAMSSDGGINIFGLDSQDHAVMLRFSLRTNKWTSTDITTATGSETVSFPIGASSAGGRMTVGTKSRNANSTMLLYVMDLDTELWSWQVGSDGPIV